jgi:hypothetical protein
MPPIPPSNSQLSGLHDQLAQGLQQLQSLGINTGGGAEFASSGQFGITEAQTQQIPVPVVLNGQTIIGHLSNIAAAQRQRIASLEAALQSDSQRTGTANAVDMQKLSLEKTRNEQLGMIIQKLTPLASTIDQNEAIAVAQLVQNANGTGAFDAAQLQRVMVHIEGSARNLPASYMAAADRAADVTAALQERVRTLSNEAAATIRQTGVPNQAQLQQVRAAQEQQMAFASAVKRNFDLAKVNPSVAEAALARALQATDPAQMVQLLG